MTAYETAALLRNWEAAIAGRLRTLLTGPIPSGAPGDLAKIGGTDSAHAHPAKEALAGEERPMPAGAHQGERGAAVCQAPAVIVRGQQDEDGLRQAAAGVARVRTAEAEETGAIRPIRQPIAGSRTFLAAEGHGYRICVRRLRSDPCWCRQTPALSIEWVVDILGRQPVVHRLVMTLVLGLDGHLPSFAGGLTLQSRFHGLLERCAKTVSDSVRPASHHAAPDAGDSDDRQEQRLLFSSIVIAD